MVLVLIRHGQSEWNKENKFTGWTEVPLTETGKQEGVEAGKLLSKYKFSSAFVSSMIRARTTFDCVIGQQVDNVCRDVKFADELKERDYGELTGKNKTSIAEEYGEDKLHLWRRSYHTAPPQGESLADVRKRAGNFYDTFITPDVEDKKDILVVAHGNTIRALLVHLGFYTPENVENCEIPTGVPVVVDLENNTFNYINRYELVGYQITDSRGQPTIEVKCYDKFSKKCVGKGSVPSGASCGSNEMTELRDGDLSLYKGKSVFKAVDNINNANLSLQLTTSGCKNLKGIDQQIMELDTSELKSKIGGNAVTAMSFCMADVAANLNNMELFEYLAKACHVKVKPEKLPTPLVNIINGGKHGVTDELKIQEFEKKE